MVFSFQWAVNEDRQHERLPAAVAAYVAAVIVT
jgi:hypothetical protein